MADKFAVRKYVSQKTNDPNLLINLYGVCDSSDEIQFDELPSEFVIKSNHRSGGNFSCRNNDEFNLELRKRLNKFMGRLYEYDKAE